MEASRLRARAGRGLGVRGLERGVNDRRVPVLTVLPADPERMPIGGIASFVRGFVKFAPDDFDLAFLGVSVGRPLLRWHEVVVEGRPVRFLPVTRGGLPLRAGVPIAARFALAMLAHRRRVEQQLAGQPWIAGFHRPGSDLLVPPSVAKRWRVVHLSVADLSTPGSESRWRSLSPVLDRLERRSFRRMDRIFVVNRAVADQYRRRYSDVAERIAFLPNWADPTIFRPLPEDVRARVRDELQVAADAPLLLFVGRLEGQKDPLLMVDAFAELRRTVPSAVLVVAGDGALREPMRQRLELPHRSLESSRFVGIVPRHRLADLMNAADALIITSAFETGPTVGLEALACGLPVVTTPVGEVARLVAESGAGRRTATHSPQAIASAMRETLESGQTLRSTAAAAARPLAADRVLDVVYRDVRGLAIG